MKIALCCIAKNEDQYVDEWLRYNHALGFDHIFMYENDWTCPVDYPFLTRIPWPGKFQQREAFMDFALNRSAGYGWVAYFDLDEFLVLKHNDNIHEFVRYFDSRFPTANGIAINLQTYGANNQRDRGQHPHSLLRQFTRRSDKISPYVKLIVKLPVRGSMIDPHYWTVPMTTPDGKIVPASLHEATGADIAVINHYAVKSYEDWCIRCDRGYPFSLDKISRYNDWHDWKNRDNEIEDLTAKNWFYGKD